jgi:hypothetical protein
MKDAKESCLAQVLTWEERKTSSNGIFWTRGGMIGAAGAAGTKVRDPSL